MSVAASPAPRALPVLFGLSAAHLINDLIQSLLPSVYPLLKEKLALSFFEIGLITFIFQATASVLQPLVGIYTDKKPLPMSLVVGMACSLTGLLVLAQAHAFWVVLMAAAIIGIGSSIFHPEASRVARAASGGAYGFAQSVFQVGGNAGQAVGPLVAALFILPYGQGAIGWVSIVAVIGAIVLFNVGRWYQGHLGTRVAAKATLPPLAPGVVLTIALLLVLVFSKNFYMAGMQSFFGFVVMERFGLDARAGQLYTFVFMLAAAFGVLAGGPLADRIGRRTVLWLSVIGALPFSLALPMATSLPLTVVASFIAAFLIALPSSAIIVEAQQAAPGRVGLIGGLFFGFAFGAGGLGAAVLGGLADKTGLETIYLLMAFLPALGLAILFIPRRAAPSLPRSS